MNKMSYTRGINREQQHKQWFTNNGKPTLNLVLTIVAIALALIILFGTAIALVNPQRKLEAGYRRADPTPQKVINKSKKKNAAVAAYTSIGEIRTVTKREDNQANGTVMVIIPWFSYPEGDTVLYEELVQKTRQFRSIFTEYFSSNTKGELFQKGEDVIKEELKERINEELVLGDITDIYFSDYLFFD